MGHLQIIDILCDITSKQAEMLKELVYEIEHTKQISDEIKGFYRERLDKLDGCLENITH